MTLCGLLCCRKAPGTKRAKKRKMKNNDCCIGCPWNSRRHLDQKEGQQGAKSSQVEGSVGGEALLTNPPDPISSALVIGTWGRTRGVCGFQVVTTRSSSFRLIETLQSLRPDLGLAWMEGWEAFQPSTFLLGTPTKPWTRIVMPR